MCKNAPLMLSFRTSNLFKYIVALLLAAMAFVSCGGDEPIDPTPVTPVTPVDPNPPIPEKDTTAPAITVSKSSVNVISGPSVTVSGNEMKIGSDLVASWKDDKSSSCTVSITFTGKDGASKAVNSGDKLEEEGKLKLKVSDEAGNSSEAEITLTKSDSQAPEIEVKIAEKNVIAGVKVKVEGNQLFFADLIAATWKDDYTENCTAQLCLEGQTVNSGDVLQEAGKLVIAVSDDFKNEATAEIVLTADAIYGLERLKNLSLQVDKEVNLLQGITYADGVSLDKVEIEANGNRVVVQDPNHYVPETPGTIDLIITVKAGSRALEFRVDNLEVKGLDYNAPQMVSVDVIGEQYSWYTDLPDLKQEFIYDHILVSYYASEWCKVDNLEFIIFGETTQYIECENVGFESINIHFEHADFGYRGIKSITPLAIIKTCGGNWRDLFAYIEQHPEKMFMVSCANGDCVSAARREDLHNHGNYITLKSILQKENLILCMANGNVSTNFNKILNETEIEHEKGIYSSTSVNSDINNKYCVLNYNPYSQNILLDYSSSICRLPVGDYPRQNRIVELCSIHDDGTASSYPTSQFGSTLSNHLSILMHNNPGTTLEGANSIMLDTYLWGQHLMYKDENDGTIKEGNLKYRIDTRKFIHNEILHETEVKSAFRNTPQSLPSTGGLYYEGKGIQFAVDGQTYDMTEENRATLENVVKSGKEVTWTYNADQAKKYGVSGENTVSVGVMDRQARLIPDISLQVQVR